MTNMDKEHCNSKPAHAESQKQRCKGGLDRGGGGGGGGGKGGGGGGNDLKDGGVQQQQVGGGCVGVGVSGSGGGNAAIGTKIKLREINPHLTCHLCKGYLIDVTTISECLHSFCRSCIIEFLQDNSHCPVCEVVINKAKPNLKLDKTLQDIVYKLVPGLFLDEMKRRREFYRKHPKDAVRVSPEQRGEDTERTIFNAQDTVSLCLEYISDDSTPGAILFPHHLNGVHNIENTEPNVNSASATSIDGQTTTTTGLGIQKESVDHQSIKRFLLCPGMCRVDVLKKFVSKKYNVDTTRFHIDVLYKRVPLPDHYTLIDIAYIYSWKRNEPMKFFFRITDLKVVRDRFDYLEPTLSTTMVQQSLPPSSSAPLSSSTPVKTPTLVKPSSTLVKPSSTLVKPSSTPVKPSPTLVKPSPTHQQRRKESLQPPRPPTPSAPVPTPAIPSTPTQASSTKKTKSASLQRSTLVNNSAGGGKLKLKVPKSVRFNVSPKVTTNESLHSQQVLRTRPPTPPTPKARPSTPILAQHSSSSSSSTSSSSSVMKTKSSPTKSSPTKSSVNKLSPNGVKLSSDEMKTLAETTKKQNGLIAAVREKHNSGVIGKGGDVASKGNVSISEKEKFLKSIELTARNNVVSNSNSNSSMKTGTTNESVVKPCTSTITNGLRGFRLTKSSDNVSTLNLNKGVQSKSPKNNDSGATTTLKTKKCLSDKQQQGENTICNNNKVKKKDDDDLKTLLNTCKIPSSLSITCVNGDDDRDALSKPPTTVINHIEILKLPDVQNTNSNTINTSNTSSNNLNGNQNNPNSQNINQNSQNINQNSQNINQNSQNNNLNNQNIHQNSQNINQNNNLNNQNSNQNSNQNIIQNNINQNKEDLNKAKESSSGISSTMETQTQSQSGNGNKEKQHKPGVHPNLPKILTPSSSSSLSSTKLLTNKSNGVTNKKNGTFGGNSSTGQQSPSPPMQKGVKRNLLEIASQLICKKAKLDHEPNPLKSSPSTTPTLTSTPMLANNKVAIPRLTNKKSSPNGVETLTNLHSNALSMNYSVSISQPTKKEITKKTTSPKKEDYLISNNKKSEDANKLVDNASLVSSSMPSPPHSANAANANVAQNQKQNHNNHQNNHQNNNKTNPELDLKQLQEKYNIQNLAQLSATFAAHLQRTNGGVGGIVGGIGGVGAGGVSGGIGGAGNPLAAIQQAMLLKHHLDSQRWLKNSSGSVGVGGGSNGSTAVSALGLQTGGLNAANTLAMKTCPLAQYEKFVRDSLNQQHQKSNNNNNNNNSPPKGSLVNNKE